MENVTQNISTNQPMPNQAMASVSTSPTVPNTSMPNSPMPNKPPGNPKKKKILAVVALAFFLLVSIVGVMIVQRQRLTTGPQAPTAPTSRPSAVKTDPASCTLSFTVPEPGVSPTPSPSVSPSPGVTPEIVCEGKFAYQDEPENGTDQDGDGILDYSLQVEQDEFTAGDIVVFAVDVGSSYAGAPVSVPVEIQDSLGGSNLTDNVTFMDSNCGPGAFNPQTRLLTCNFDKMVGAIEIPEKFGEVIFRVRLAENINETVTLTNTATISSEDGGRLDTNSCSVTISMNPPVGGPSPSPTPTPTPGITPTPRVTPTPGVSPSPTPESVYQCNASCTTDEQCQTANAAYVCDPETDQCRLDSNRTDIACQPKANEYSCNSLCQTTAQCQTANSGYICDTNSGRCRAGAYPDQSNCLAPDYTPPPPSIGCNETCTTNADCSNSNHICYTTSDGSNRCRLETYPNSNSCANPPVYTPIETTVAQTVQPTLPEELPESGAQDIVNWLKAGLVALALGAILLLLL